MPLKEPTNQTISQEKIKITIVRNPVITSLFTFRTPILAKIEVIPAKKADPIAKTIQFIEYLQLYNP